MSRKGFFLMVGALAVLLGAAWQAWDARRFPKIERTGPIDLLRSHFIDGVKHMPVRLSA